MTNLCIGLAYHNLRYFIYGSGIPGHRTIVLTLPPIHFMAYSPIGVLLFSCGIGVRDALRAPSKIFCSAAEVSSTSSKRP